MIVFSGGTFHALPRVTMKRSCQSRSGAGTTRKAGGWMYQQTENTGERWFNEKLGLQLRISISHSGQIRLYSQYLGESGPAAERGRAYLTRTWSSFKS